MEPKLYFINKDRSSLLPPETQIITLFTTDVIFKIALHCFLLPQIVIQTPPVLMSVFFKDPWQPTYEQVISVSSRPEPNTLGLLV
jgi:hypothetical protein